MDVDRTLIDIDVAAPYTVEQLRPTEHAAWALHEKFEQTKLGWSEMHLAAVARHPMRLPVELDVAGGKHRGDTLRAGAPQDRAHARHQLRQGKRLDHIVVGAGGEPTNAVALFAARRQQDNRDKAGSPCQSAGAGKAQAQRSRATSSRARSDPASLRRWPSPPHRPDAPHRQRSPRPRDCSGAEAPTAPRPRRREPWLAGSWRRLSAYQPADLKGTGVELVVSLFGRWSVIDLPWTRK